MREGVVITGIGCVSCFGTGHRAFADRIRSGASGIAPITRFDTAACHSRTAAMIRDFDPAAFFSPLKLRRVDAVGRVALACARLLFDAHPGAQGEHVGIALGTSTAGLDSLAEYLDGLSEHGPAGVPAILFSNTVANAPASLCAIEFGLRGPNVTFNQREASSLAALAFSIGAIRQGRTTAMVTGGADGVEETFFKVHDRFRALSPMRGALSSTSSMSSMPGAEAARPFDRDRNGFILGEGGFLLLVESATAAEQRGARVYGEIAGVGATASKTELNGWPADGAGLAKAMRLALSDAGILPDEVGAVIGTSNGSPALDRHEADAIAEVFGSRSIPVASVKGAVGESGASGAAGLIAGLLSIGAGGTLVPTAGFLHPDPALAVCVSSRPQPVKGDAFLVNSVASGGTNYSLLVRAIINVRPGSGHFARTKLIDG
jgi:3-oxoacyl-[acyl-carrier-protein] synthase II